MANRCPTLNGRLPLPTKSCVFGVIVPWCTRKIPTLPTKGSITTLNTCASACAFAPGTAKNSCASAPSPLRKGGALPSVAFGASLTNTSSSSSIPAPFLAEVKHTGIRWPSRNAFSKGACSSSGATSPFSRYCSISFSSTSTTWSTSAECAALTEEKSESPSGLKKQSTTAVAPFAGRLIGRHSLPTASRIFSSIASTSAFSASIRFTTIMRQRFRFAAHLSMRSVASCTPVSALITTIAVSTAASAPIACPMKSGDPGVSTRWMCAPFQAKFTIDELSECLYSRSSGSESQTVLPRSTLPAAGIAPAFASSASASVVLPAPVWPTSATVRIASVEYFAMSRSPRSDGGEAALTPLVPRELWNGGMVPRRPFNPSPARSQAGVPPGLDLAADAHHAHDEAPDPVGQPHRDAPPHRQPEPVRPLDHQRPVLERRVQRQAQLGGEGAVGDDHVRLAR